MYKNIYVFTCYAYKFYSIQYIFNQVILNLYIIYVYITHPKTVLFHEFCSIAKFGKTNRFITVGKGYAYTIIYKRQAK